jgi:protein subunit release factor B
MSLFAPSPEKEAQLAARMSELGVRESDLEESFVRSAGHGGQNVNKTATCVMLRHKPTGMAVKCQETRHQGQNRLIARRLLLDKISERIQARRDEARSASEKVRRSNRPRSRGAKRRMLADKSRRAVKKSFRRAVSDA